MPDDKNPTSSSSTITPLPATMTSRIKGPGLLYVRSSIAPSAKDILDEPTFLKWYDEDHIPEVVSTSGIKSAFRYVDNNKDTAFDESKPFLAIYPMQDIAFMLSDEFKSINVKSSLLPRSGIVYDYTDMDVSYLTYAQKTYRSDDDPSGPAPALLICEAKPPAGTEREKVAGILGEQIHTLHEESGYMRTLIFDLQLARTSGPGRSGKETEISTWVVIHEFRYKPGGDMVKRIQQKMQDMQESLGTMYGEVRVWELARAFGEEKMLE